MRSYSLISLLLLLLATNSAPALCGTSSFGAIRKGGRKITLLDFYPTLNQQDSINTYLPSRTPENRGNLLKADVTKYTDKIPMKVLFGKDCRSMHPPLTIEERNGYPFNFILPFSCADVSGVLLFQLLISQPKVLPQSSQDSLANLRLKKLGAGLVSKEVFWVSRVSNGNLSPSGRLYYAEATQAGPAFCNVPYRLGDGPFSAVQMNAFASFSAPNAPRDWAAGEAKAAAFFAEAEARAHENRERENPPTPRYLKYWMEKVRGDALRPSEWVSELYLPWATVAKHQLAWDIKHRDEILESWPDYQFPPEAGV